MRLQVTLTSAILLLASNSWAADQAAYYNIEEISVDADGANYGSFPSAISDDGLFIGTYSLKAALSSDIDIASPFTFNHKCSYDAIICELLFSGSEAAEDSSYENAYKQWRNAQSNAINGYSRYFMGNTLLNGSDLEQSPYATGVTTSDIKVTDVTQPLPDATGSRFVIGYASAPYVEGKRDYVRRAFIKTESGSAISLLPQTFTGDNGGLSSAYKLQNVTYQNGVSKTLIVGASSISYPENSDENFNNCFFSDTTDELSTLNELVYCPGFDTQAWAWDVTSMLNGDLTDVAGYPLATHWLGENPENTAGYNTAHYGYLTFNASALDINKSGVAVGVSTFEYSDTLLGGRQRAVIMQPTSTGEYNKPTVITQATSDIGDTDEQDSGIYNTWAQAISDDNLVLGNREYGTSKAKSLPFEFFVYDIDSDDIKIPLKDTKVLTTKQRLAGITTIKTGASSRAYDINNNGLVVGEVDDYDQNNPSYQARPRSQSAFLYDNSTSQSWFINDLICTQTSDIINSPNLRIVSAKLINDDGTVLAEGFKYPSADDYRNKINGQKVMLKLTRNADVISPNDSPNCWQSPLLNVEDVSYERSGGASFWLWIFALPLLFIRRRYSFR